MGPPKGQKLGHESSTSSAHLGLRVVVSAMCFNHELVRAEELDYTRYAVMIPFFILAIRPF